MDKQPRETGGEGLLITDENGEIQTVNKEFTKITGYTSEEVLGKNPRFLKSGMHSEDFYSNLWTTIEIDGHWHGLIWNKRKSGEVYLECLTINRINSMDKKAYYIATLKDVINCESEEGPCKLEEFAEKRGYSRETKIKKADILDALYNEEFEIYYQPLLTTETKRFYGIEALIRWNHPTYGLLTPMEFIPLAEKNGLIVPITEWLIDRALLQINMLHKLGFKELRILINISVIHFNNSNFVEMVRYYLNRNRVAANFLELEITESIFLEATDKVINKINEIKRLGVRMSIDDFGTGYSSLLYLKHFPFDTLKIDRAFTKDINLNKGNNVLVEAIIRMGKSLNLCVIAEGVETEEQAVFLEKNNCDVIQGYLLSKPVMFNQLLKVLSDNRMLNIS